MSQVQAAVLCNTRQLRPRSHIKAEDDFASSDDDKRNITSYESLDDMPRIVPGERLCPFACCMVIIQNMMSFIVWVYHHRNACVFHITPTTLMTGIKAGAHE